MPGRWSALLEGASAWDEVRAAVRAAPVIVVVGRSGVAPESEGLGAVVSPAQAGEVVGSGLSGWTVLVVGRDVVEVVGAGVGFAAGEDAVLVAEDDELAHPGWWVVLVDGVATGHVEDGLDDDLVVADPVPDLGERGGADFSTVPVAKAAPSVSSTSMSWASTWT